MVQKILFELNAFHVNNATIEGLTRRFVDRALQYRKIFGENANYMTVACEQAIVELDLKMDSHLVSDSAYNHFFASNLGITVMKDWERKMSTDQEQTMTNTHGYHLFRLYNYHFDGLIEDISHPAVDARNIQTKLRRTQKRLENYQRNFSDFL